MTDPFDHLSVGGKFVIDLLSIGTLMATLVQILPSIAALLTIIWTGIRIFETDTVRGWLGRVRNK